MSKKDISKKGKPQRRKKSMSKILLIIGGVLLLIGSAVSAVVKNNGVGKPEFVEAQGQPAIKVDHESIDYGDVKLNQRKSFTITVTNVGDESLRFSAGPYIELVDGC